MTEIRVPKLNANDTTYTFVEWLVTPGTAVRAGDPVATVETSKAAEELLSEADGLLHPLVLPGAECAAGTVIGRLLAPGAAALEAPTAPADAPAAPADAPAFVLTEPARRLVEAHGLSPAAVEALGVGRRVLRASDLTPLLPAAPAAPAASAASAAFGLQELPPVQRAVGAVVTESHRTVPAGFVAVKVALDAALAHGQELTRRHRRLIGVPELLVAALGTLLPRHPLCFAAFAEPGLVRPATTVDVGVTVDVGKGLHVPVVRDVAAQPIAAIAERLMRLRMTALRGTFRPDDLTGANILLALHTDDDVTVAVPIVPPGTTCAVSLAGRTSELRLDDAGAVTRHTVVQLGLAYDHRVINGRDAVEFLRAARDLLQTPTTLT